MGDDLYRFGLAELLREGGVDVVATAESADSAGAAAQDRRVDVALIEVGHEAGGVAVARLRQVDDPPTVLALTAFPNHDEALDVLAAGAAGYLPMDAHTTTLAGAVHALHAGELLMPWYVANTVLAPFREDRRPIRRAELIGEPLTERETEVLRLVAHGMANDEIARELFLTTSTVKNHMTRIVAKLGARNRTHAAVLAVHRRYV